MNEFSRPHYTKLTACLNNPRLPEADRERLEEAIIKYRQWIIELESINSILEEFLPQLIFRSLQGIDNSFELGPRNTFSGLSFLSSLGNIGQGGQANIRSKNQDFMLGKKLYIKSSFDPEFQNYELIESHLGYVCAECKTNLDKTMFQEAVATSRDLKIAVPNSLYFLICEFLDMTPVMFYIKDISKNFLDIKFSYFDL